MNLVNLASFPLGGAASGRELVSALSMTCASILIKDGSEGRQQVHAVYASPPSRTKLDPFRNEAPA
jgi:hypothetical protein